jgi:hypothetical protein
VTPQQNNNAMTSQPDKLFRDKLENFQQSAPAAAWERIEAGLEKNQHKGLWMKIAAGLLLLSVAAFLLWPTTPSENTHQVTNTTQVIPENERIEKNKKEENAPTLTAKQDPVKKRIAPKKQNDVVKKDEPVLVAESIENNALFIEPIETVAVVEINSAEKVSSRTILYTAEEVNAKFMRKKSPSEATSVAKKSSGIQKLMGLAYDLKNNTNGLGDLRQKKDEILALNFLNNEDQTNKRKN